jgi:tetratricopeptide (TPR) repeat protein
MEEYMKHLINLLMIAFFLAMMACGANLAAKKKAPVEPVKTPLELALESAQSAEMSFEDTDFPAAIEKFNKAIDFYNEAIPTAAAEDSVTQKIFNIRKNIANIHIIYAQDLSGQNEYDSALASYESAISLYKELLPLSSPADSIAALMPSLYKNTAITSRQSGEFTKALEYYDKYLELNPEDDDILLQKFAIYRDDLKNEEQAFEVLKAYAISKNDFNASHRLGDLYAGNNDVNNAILWYEKADSIKIDANVLKKLGNLYRSDKKQMWANSNDALERFITMNPNTDELKTAYKLIGGNYDKLKNKAKSIEYFEKYIELEYNENIALLICSYYFDRKDNKNTIKWATTILQNNPNNAAALLFRGISRYNLKDNKGAKADFERIKDDPKYGKNAQDYLKIIK